MIKIFTADLADHLKEMTQNSIIKSLDESRNFFLCLDEDFYFLTFHWLDGKKVTILASRGDLLSATDSRQVRQCMANIDTPTDGIMQFHEFLLELTANDSLRLESLENMIISLEERLLLEKKPGKKGISDILSVRKDLLKIKRYYAQMEFLTDEMAAVNPAFGFIDKKFHRLFEFTLHLQEYIDQVREAYQAQIDIEQNNIMKVFTVVTSIFLPLTLIAGWYGMNFQLPEYKWAHGYVFVAAMSLSVILILLVIFKKKKWF